MIKLDCAGEEEIKINAQLRGIVFNQICGNVWERASYNAKDYLVEEVNKQVRDQVLVNVRSSARYALKKSVKK
jgi:hypothetical protein